MSCGLHSCALPPCAADETAVDAATVGRSSPFCAVPAYLVHHALCVQSTDIAPPAQHHAAPDGDTAVQADAAVEACAADSVAPKHGMQCSSDTAATLSLASATTIWPGALAPSVTGLQNCPPHGVKAVCGKRAKMEDAFSVQTNFFDLPIPHMDAEGPNKLPARIALQVGEQLEAGNSSSTSHACSIPLSPKSTSGATSLASSQQESSMAGSNISMTSTTPADLGSCDTLHFFAVYDGHGGIEAAQHCANRLHYHLSQSLAAVGTAAVQGTMCVPSATGALECQAEWTLCEGCTDTPTAASPSAVPKLSFPAGLDCDAAAQATPVTVNAAAAPLDGCAAGTAQLSEQAGRVLDESEQQPQPAPNPSTDTAGSSQPSEQQQQLDEQLHMEPSQAAMGEHTGNVTPVEREAGASFDVASNGSGTSEHSSLSSWGECLEGALRDAFLKTDAEFAEDNSSAMVGSTAVVALVGSKKLWIANCGDSRAVLCRGGNAIQVTDDHKPEREDEAERVEKAGGQVLYWNGHRVMGVLAMSRAIGDHGLRPYVICEPEITVLSRVGDDDFLLLASDGLWDVMTNQEAIILAMRCMQRAWEKGGSRKAAVRVAAAVLTRAAVDRGSKDNVTVVIVDLKAPQPTASSGPPDASCDGGSSSCPGVSLSGQAPQPGHGCEADCADPLTSSLPCQAEAQGVAMSSSFGGAQRQGSGGLSVALQSCLTLSAPMECLQPLDGPSKPPIQMGLVTQDTITFICPAMLRQLTQQQ